MPLFRPFVLCWTLSCVWLFATLYTVAHQTLGMGVLQARILEWVAMSPAGDFPNQGIKLKSLTSPALAGEFFTTSTIWEAHLGLLPIGLLCPDTEAHCQGLNIPDHTFVVFCKRSLRSERFSWLVKMFHCPRLFLQRLGLGGLFTHVM